MCRFVFYVGPEISLASLVTDPDHSLIHQSFQAREREEPLNGDGFGVAWFQPEVHDRPIVFKEVMPAWSSINLASMAPVTRSHCMMAHVRAASPGLAVTQLNCHPFARGPFAFMHNGEVGGFLQTRRELLAGLSDEQFHQIQSTGDSEVVFAIAMDALADAGIDCRAGCDVEAMGRALVTAIEHVERVAREAGSDEEAYLNLVITDGRRAAITRYVTPSAHQPQSLYVHEGGRYRCEEGVCSMLAPEAAERTVIVSSEPLSGEPGWKPVPVNHLLLIDADHEVSMQPIRPVRSLAA